MCNCIKEMGEKIKIAALKKEEVESVSFVLPQNSLPSGENFGIGFFYGCQIKQKNGKIKYAEKTVNILALYCPFCGEKKLNKTPK